MVFLKRETVHRGFSLIELLIVIIIISIVYFLGFSGMEKPDTKAKAITPLTLKQNIVKSEYYQGEGTLMCMNKCRTCYLRKDINTPYEAYEGELALQDLEAYTLDADEALLRLDYGRYDDKKVCLVMHFYTNGSSTQLIIKQKDDVYFLPAFFGEPRKVDSLDEAKRVWLQKNSVVKNKGDYY